MKKLTKLNRLNFAISSALVGGVLLGGCASTDLQPDSNRADFPAPTANAYLEITLLIKAENRPAAAAVYAKYKQPFLEQIDGAQSKQLLLRVEDVQVLHGFSSEASAQAYLSTDLFGNDVVRELKDLLEASPEVRIYGVN